MMLKLYIVIQKGNVLCETGLGRRKYYLCNVHAPTQRLKRKYFLII